MPPRVMPSRHGGSRGGRGGRNADGRDPLAVEGFRALQRQIDVLQEQMRRGLNPRRRGESEDEEEEEEVIDQDQMRLIRAILKIGKRPRIEVPSYSGSLNLEELID